MDLKERQLVNIQNFLPHREPMLMVDYILTLTQQNVETSFQITPDNIFVQNGFFVEAGLVENIAQTCSSIFGQNFFSDKNTETKLIGFITNIKKIEVFGLPKVGDTLISKATFVSQYENSCNVLCESFCNDVLLIKADINLFIQEIL